MIKDYEIEESECVVCGKESNNLPLCPYCYNSYKKFFNHREDLRYCNKNIKYAMLKLFAYFDLLEKNNIDDGKTEFLIDFARMIQPLVKDDEFFLENDDKNQTKKTAQDNEKLRTPLEAFTNNNASEILDPRKKWPAKYRCKDGHYVRSRAELLIDNWLFSEGIKHIYEKQVTFPNGEKCLCDFFLPDYSSYIEFWGLQDDYYIKRKNIKTNLYKTLKDIKLIEINDKSLENLDDILEDFINNFH